MDIYNLTREELIVELQTLQNANEELLRQVDDFRNLIEISPVAINDITERRAVQQQLRESEERYKALHDASFGGIVIHDKGIIIECNQGLTDISGFAYDELIGMDGLLLIAPVTRELVYTNIISGYEKPYEAMGIRKNGEIYPLRLEARNVPYKGKIVRTVEFRDITESKLMQSELQKIEWLLKPRGVPDEYYEPVYGDITRLNSGGLIKKALGENYLKNIVNDFMVLLETSCAVYERNGDYAIGVFSSGWCKFMDNSSFELCKTKDLNKALCSGEWLCHESCWTDASQKAMDKGEPVDIQCNGGIHLYAVLTNLVKNAIKYSHSGTIEIGYSVIADNDRSILELYVKDEGIGIPIERQEAVFERFVQADIADTMARQGAGLGLSISKAYVALMGGDIWLESVEGQGSTFYFTLPFQQTTTN